MSLYVTLPDYALDMRLDVWLDRHMESLRASHELVQPQTGRRPNDPANCC